MVRKARARAHTHAHTHARTHTHFADEWYDDDERIVNYKECAKLHPKSFRVTTSQFTSTD